MTLNNNAKLCQILLVEDSPDDTLLTREALREAKMANELNVVEDGEEAMDYVRNNGRYAEATRPDLILLDLNLPKKDGREVLVELKEGPDLKRIPVVVLTTSASDEDVVRAYDHHVNAYIRKPIDLNQFVEMVHKIDEFWLGIVTLPPA